MSRATPFKDHVAARPPGDPCKVFPVQPGGKAPATTAGHKDATADPAQLQAWARQMPTANVGLDPHSLGLCVIDLDGADGEEAWLQLLACVLPDITVSPSRQPSSLAVGEPRLCPLGRACAAVPRIANPSPGDRETPIPEPRPIGPPRR